MLKEFRDFIARGNALDLAIGIIIGGAFGAIVNSSVNDILMPPIGLLLGGVDFTNLFVNLTERPFGSLAAAKNAGAPTINYGVFINTVINFLVISFVIFMLIKQINRLKRPAEVKAPTTKDCPHCLSTIPLRATRCPHCTSELRAA